MSALPRPSAGAAPVLAPTRRERRPARGGPPLVPPFEGGEGGEGGGGNGGGGFPPGGTEGAGPLALGLALIGIATLFLVLIAVWVFLRRPAPDWNAPFLGAAPHALWTSTACLAASSLAVELAARRARRGERSPAGNRRAARRWLAGSLLLGCAFLAAQADLWVSLWRAGFVPAASGYAAVFFALTGLHALHVLGGLGFLGFLARELGRGRRAPSVRLGAVYWHCMGGLWLVLFTLLYFVR